MEQQWFISALVYQHNSDKKAWRRTSKYKMPTIYVCKPVTRYANSAECNYKFTPINQHHIWRTQKVVCEFQKSQPDIREFTTETQQVLLRSDKFRRDSCSIWSKIFLIWPSSQQKHSSWPSSSSSSRLCSAKSSTFLDSSVLRKSLASKLFESQVLPLLSSTQTSSVSSES